MVVGGDVDNLNNGDEELADILTGMDYLVLIEDDNEEVLDLNPSIGVVVISQSAVAGTVAGEYRNIKVPVLVMNSGVFDDMRMTGAGANGLGTTNGREVEIRKTDHPMAAGLTGRIAISQQNSALNWGVPGNTAVVVATLANDPARATVFGYEEGAALQGGQVAPAKRVGFFAGNDLADRMNNNGVKLFEAAITWAWSR